MGKREKGQVQASEQAVGGQAVVSVEDQIQEQAAVSPAFFDTGLLRALNQASKTEPGFMYVARQYFEPLQANGYAEVKNDVDVNEQGELPVAITEGGKAYLLEIDGPEANAAATAEKQKRERVKPQISAVVDFDINSVVRTRKVGEPGERQSMFDFDSLEVNKAFFIPATEKRPDPAKQYASAVANAKKKYATFDANTLVKNKRGNDVPKATYTRDFKLVKMVDGAQFGEQYKGVPGAAIVRVA